MSESQEGWKAYDMWSHREVRRQVVINCVSCCPQDIVENLNTRLPESLRKRACALTVRFGWRNHTYRLQNFITPSSLLSSIIRYLAIAPCHSSSCERGGDDCVQYSVSMARNDYVCQFIFVCKWALWYKNDTKYIFQMKRTNIWFPTHSLLCETYVGCMP